MNTPIDPLHHLALQNFYQTYKKLVDSYANPNYTPEKEDVLEVNFHAAVREVSMYDDDTREAGQEVGLVAMASALVAEAERQGVNITIERCPLTPLAMGAHNAVIKSWPKLHLLREGKL